VVDIGTGCGIIALLLAQKWPTLKVWGIEVQPELARLAKENAARNRLGERCTILEADARQGADLLLEEGFQRVVSNPPFRPPATGRVSPEPQRALARQEISLTFADLVASASALLGHGGTFDFIHLPERLPEIFRTLTEGSLEPKKLRLVHSYRDKAPDMALISARKGGHPGLDLLPPLVIFRSRGVYTAETRRVLRLCESRNRES
jgi:tRNA1Val (adenine37-N6)-methyltransferase